MIRSLGELHRARCNENGPINEHLPVLYMLSRMSHGVVEFGVDTGISTSALILGQDIRASEGLEAWYTGVDINPKCQAEINRLAHLRENNFPVTFMEASTIQINPINPVDFLFIDSLHTEETIRAELKIHLSRVRKYVALHDTVTFGENGETKGTRGLLYGISELISPDWALIYDTSRSHGFAVFARKKSLDSKPGVEV